MRYALLMHYREPAEGEISEEAIAEAMEAFGAYGRALEEAGVLRSGDVLQPSAATTTVTRRDGGLRVQDGPFAETKEALAGMFVLDVPDLDAAIGWAEKCPGAQWGVIEVRPTATALRRRRSGRADAGRWTAGPAGPGPGGPGPAARRRGAGGPRQLRAAARAAVRLDQRHRRRGRRPRRTRSSVPCAPGPRRGRRAAPTRGC